MYSDLSFVSFLTVCAVVFIYATGSRRDDIRVQFQQQQLHTFRRPSTVAHHLAAERIRRLVSVCNAAEVIFGLVPSAHGRNTKKKNK